MDALFYRTPKGATAADCKTAEFLGTLKLGEVFRCDIDLKDRTLSQNAISHVWYTEVSKKEGEYTPGEVKNLCKYHIGLPILRGEDAKFNAICEQWIDPLPYEEKIAAMEFLPVTSRMSKKQKSVYLEGMQKNYSGRVHLIFPGGAPR
ncbi:hypothetical protein [Sulfurovum sp.]|uniref:hypothetical protein n=1 Tax=Sulfurovum sp. TaxID=1969726 RepID=UPI003561E118